MQPANTPAPRAGQGMNAPRTLGAQPKRFLREGVYAALWVPVDPAGAVMKQPLEQHLEFLGSNASGLSGLMVDASTGEFPVFTEEQRLEPLSMARRFAPSLDIIYNASHPDFRTVIRLGWNALRHGCSAIALLPPWFYPMPQDDIAEFFVRASESWDHEVPLLLYNYPEVTGNKLEIEMIAWVAERAPVCCIKQSGAAFEYHKELIELGASKRFAVFTGADTRLAEAMSMGVMGCVSGLSNAIPELVAAVFNSARNGRDSETEAASSRIAAVARAIRPLPFALNVAAAVAARGFAAGEPKYVRSPRTMETYQAVVAELQRLFAEWGLRV